MATKAWEPAWPRSAADLLAQAKEASAVSGDLVRLVMGGIRRLDSWLIENRILPALAEKEIEVLGFTLANGHHEQRTAAMVPLPDATAFACSASGRWTDLDAQEALAAIQHIGFRYAVGDHWVRGFLATRHPLGGTPAALTPAETAAFWEGITGTRPHGFESGVLDQMQAFGLIVMDKAFNTQGLLGL